MKKYLNKTYLPAMLGASIEYYDIALYGYMAPVLVPIFFPFLDATTSYFAYFLFEFIAAIFQFFGAKLFGSFGDKYGRKPAMFNSMLGISIATFAICLLPTYKQIGIISTVLFFILRVLQRFFLGGEYNDYAIVFVKIVFTILASFFIAPFHAWTQELCPPNVRYRTISISYTFGKCISTLVISFIFIAYEYFKEIQILGILLSLFSIITVRFIYEKYFDATTKALSCD